MHEPRDILRGSRRAQDRRLHALCVRERGRWAHAGVRLRATCPKGTIVWSIQQDHVRPDLFFLGTEFGLYWTPNGGRNWHELGGGVPTIAFRDLKIHRRDSDLVGATFGRGFYVLDDYTPLRALAAGGLDSGDALFPVRDAWWYVPYRRRAGARASRARERRLHGPEPAVRRALHLLPEGSADDRAGGAPRGARSR